MVMNGENEKLIEKLSKIKLEETSIKRELDRYYRNDAIRTRMFKRLKQIQKEKEQINFKLRIERLMRNDKQ